MEAAAARKLEHFRLLCRTISSPFEPFHSAGMSVALAVAMRRISTLVPRLVVRLRAPLAIVLALILPIASCVPQQLRKADSGVANDPTLETGAYLVRQAPGRMLVVLRHSQQARPQVEHWIVCRACALDRPQEALITLTEAERHEGRWVAVLTDLPKTRSQRVAYRVVSSAGASPIRSFTAGAEKNEAFRFAVFGDTRTGHVVHRSVVEAVAAENVDFFVHTGDLVEFGGLEHEWDRFFQIEQPLLEIAPIFPAIGNHDASNQDHFGKAFLTVLWTDTLHYYYQDWGNLRIVTLDSGVECRGGCTQSYFARLALAEGARRGMLLMISLHFPPYSSGAHGSYLRLRDAIQPLAQRYGVELVVAGHDHNYERTRVIKGTSYVVAAASGAPTRLVKPQSFSESVRTEAHYLLVDAEHNRLSLRAVNLQGHTFDTAVLRASTPTRSLAELQQDEQQAREVLAILRRQESWPQRPSWARVVSKKRGQ